MALTLSFHGGAGTVTGSRYLLESAGTTILVDAGLFQGLKKLRLLNWRPPDFDVDRIDHLLLTHAHIDHAGYLPRLVQDGYQGPVHCTTATFDLARLLLLDAAKIQEEDARYANKRGFSTHHPALPLYTTADAEQAFTQMQPTSYGTWLEVGAGIRARFLNVGHILGAAMIELRIPTPDGERTIVFSGDVGRYGVPLHSDPDPLPPCDALVVESTYGDREHGTGTMAEQIREPIQRAIERGGTVLIPSFAVGRAQLVTLCLRTLMNAGTIPELPIHIDSPMAVNATRIYSKHLHDLSLDESLSEDGRNRLFPGNVHFHRSVEESKALNALSGSRIIISSSGMLTGGRVLHHLRRILPDERNLVLLVGYQAAGTRGRRMLEGATTVRVHGQDIGVRAELQCVSGLSAHADRTDLLRWIRTARDGGTGPRVVFVTHGEPEASTAFATLLQREFQVQTHTPELGASFDLGALLGVP
jgi:metallo-beta-lactamase family protein